jgi:hypothetical protein
LERPHEEVAGGPLSYKREYKRRLPLQGYVSLLKASLRRRGTLLVSLLLLGSETLKERGGEYPLKPLIGVGGIDFLFYK